MAAVDKSVLERWRQIDSCDVLIALAEYAKRDTTFIAVKDPRTTRWHATVAGRDVELLTTGPKFWDVQRGLGGGGAVDLAMHLFTLDFKAATRLLVERGL